MDAWRNRTIFILTLRGNSFQELLEIYGFTKYTYVMSHTVTGREPEGGLFPADRQKL